MFFNESSRVSSCDSQVFKWISDGEPVRLMLIPRSMVKIPGLPAPAQKSAPLPPSPMGSQKSLNQKKNDDLLNRLQDLQKLAQEQDLSQSPVFFFFSPLLLLE